MGSAFDKKLEIDEHWFICGTSIHFLCLDNGPVFMTCTERNSTTQKGKDKLWYIVPSPESGRIRLGLRQRLKFD